MATLARALAYATAFTALLLLYVPYMILRATGTGWPGHLGVPEFVGASVALVGALLALWCVIAFATWGRGTPVPFDAPRQLVIRGPYRYVRNPMYVGAGAALAGVALFFQSWPLLGYAVVFVVAFGIFVIGYEEPKLRETFGLQYDEYCRRVNRWLPGRPVDATSSGAT